MTLTTRLVGLILTLYLHVLMPPPGPPAPQNSPQPAVVSSTWTFDQQSVAALYELLDAGAWKKALDLLRSMQSADARLYEQNRFPYLEARLLLKTGQPEPALLLLQRTRATDPLLERRILQQMVEARRALGQSNEETSLLEQLLSRFTAQVSADSLRLRLAQLEQRRGNPRRALEYLSVIQDKALRRRAGFERAAIHQAQGNTSEARREWSALVAGSTTDDWALKAVRALDRTEPATVAKEARWRRAEIYSANREFAAAEKHLHVLRSLPASRATDLYFFQTARNDFQAGRNEQAIESFREVARRFPESDFAAQAEYLVANTYLRQLKYAEAVAAYRSARRRYPDNPHLENAWNNEVDALRWLRRYEDPENGAIATAGEALASQKNAAGLNVLFNRAKVYIDLSRIPEAEADLRALVNTPGQWPPLLRADEARYWLGWTLEQQGRAVEAVEQYLVVFNPDASHYAELSRARLEALASDPVVAARLEAWRDAAGQSRRLEELQKVAALEIPGGAWEQARRQARARLDEQPAVGRIRSLRMIPERPLRSAESPAVDPVIEPFVELYFLHLFDEAAEELRALPETARRQLLRSSDAVVYHFHLATLQQRAGQTGESVQTAFRLLAAARLAGAELPPPLAQMLYPFHFRDEIEKAAARHNLDPFFIAAVIQQESLFDPRAKSGAAARGLMQLIVSTANRYSRAAGLAAVDEDDLYRPEVSIAIGAAHLKALADQFNGSPEKIAAAYNAGEDAVDRWQQKSSRVPQLFVPDIGFAETKKYVLLVLRNHNRYRQIYGGKTG